MTKNQTLWLALGALGFSAGYTLLNEDVDFNAKGFVTVFIPIGVIALIAIGFLTKK
jgi:hypothetical protein